VEEYGLLPTSVSLLVNILLAGGVFSASMFIMKLLGSGGTKALSKITSLFLAAIAVMMIRKGITQILS
jgi:multiple antibiotic resistance protein